MFFSDRGLCYTLVVVLRRGKLGPVEKCTDKAKNEHVVFVRVGDALDVAIRPLVE